MIRAGLRWIAAGLVASGVLAAADLMWMLPGPEGTDGTAVAATLLSLHLTVGLLAGIGLWGLSTALGDLTLDSLGGLWSAVFKPLRAHRTRTAAAAFVGPLLLGAAASLLFGLFRRFMSFNNQGLAAFLLVGVTAVVVSLTLAAWWALSRRLEPLVARFGVSWPEHGDAVGLWLMPGLGLVLGVLVGALSANGTAVSENWEALAVGPWLGLLTLGLLTALAEVLTRRGDVRLVGAMAVVLLLTSGGTWNIALGSRALSGADNEAVHRDSWVGTLYLTMAERLSDRDGDGFSGHFGHGDCDDADKNAWPGSLDGDDCSPPGVVLEDKDDFERRLRGEPVAVPEAAPLLEPPAAVAAEPSPIGLSPSPEAPVLTAPIEPLQPPKPALARPYNILLITVDTVRADHLGFMGYDRDTSPNLDKLAARSAVFERAYAPSNMTPASIPAMLSGRYVSELWRNDGHFIKFGRQNLFVAEQLKDAGFDTRGVVTHWYFEPRKKSGLNQGFDSWQVVGTRWGKEMEDASTSKQVSDETIHQLNLVEKQDKPWFVWAHYLDPHKWYIFHDGFDKRWGKKSIDRYDHEIAFTDHHIGRVLRRLRAHDDLKNTVVIVTSDHGEAFGEHKTMFHGFSLYEDQLRVPLIVHVPGLDPVSITQRRGLIDLTPTILDLAGVTPAERLQGRSWAADLLGKPPAQRLIYAERPRGPYSRGLRALIDGDWKITWKAAGNKYELYDLAADPDEMDNQMRKRPDQARRMQAALQSMLRLALDTKDKVQ